MTTTVEVPGVGTVEFPDSMSQAQITAAVQRMTGTGDNFGINPYTGQPGYDPGMAALNRLRFGPKPPPPPESHGLQLIKEYLNGQRPVNDALILGTIGSLAFPPARAGTLATKIPGLAGLLSRTAQRFGPTVAASATGGGLGAGLDEAQDPNATPASIAGEAASGAGRMAAAELAGLGLTTAAAKVFAPRLGFLDPLKEFRKQFGEFVSSVPEHVRNAARRVEELLPEKAANVAQAAGQAAAQANRALSEIIKQNKLGQSAAAAAKQLGNKKATAASVARALGDKAAARFGYAEGKGSQQFLFRVFTQATPEVVKTMQRRMGKAAWENFQMQNLATLITRASTRGPGGTIRLNGERFKELWDALPETAKSIYSPGARRAIESLGTFATATARLARFATTPTGSELAEAIITPLAFHLGGPVLGFPVMVAKQLLFPGPLTRYLTRDKLPNEVVQMIGGQATKTPIRATALQEEGL